MANWEEIYDGANRLVDKATKEVTRIGEGASLRLRLKSCQNKQDDEYTLLGKLTYAQLRYARDNAAKIEAVLARIDELRKTEAEIKAQIRADKEAREQEKRAAKEAREAKEAEEAILPDADAESPAEAATETDDGEGDK